MTDLGQAPGYSCMLKIVSSESPKNFAPRPTLSVLFFSKEKLNCTPPATPSIVKFPTLP